MSWKCTDCNKELIWGADYMYEEYSLEGDGIVSNLTCQNNNCDVESIIVYKKI